MAKFIINESVIVGDYNKIEINVNTTNIKILPSEDEKTKLVCHEKKRRKHQLLLENMILKVKSTEKKWLSFGFKYAELTLYIPIKKYENINIINNTGSVEMFNIFEAGELLIKTNTGSVTLDTVNCDELVSKGGTGCVSLNKLISKNNIDIKRNTGNVKLKKCDGKNIYIKTNTGRVEVNLLTSKLFITKSNTGKLKTDTMKMENTNLSGKCEIKTNTGNIILN